MFQFKNPADLKEVHFFEKGLSFPVIIYVCNDKDKANLSYLNPAVHNSKSLCKWCIKHKMEYQIAYPLKTSSVFKNPYKFYKFLQLKQQINK